MSICTPIFILSAPRTGSTYFFQFLINNFNLGYISNIVNQQGEETIIEEFEKYQKIAIKKVNFDSKFGKTFGENQPSEASNFFRKWFGGDHPSETNSLDFLTGKVKEFVTVMEQLQHANNGMPLLFKNTWNCYRIVALSRALPNAKFVWLKRDIFKAGKSDLLARKITKGSTTAWTSATPKNVAFLKTLMPEYQVLENQYHLNEKVKTDLNNLDPKCFCEFWFEDVLQKPDLVMEYLRDLFDLKSETIITGVQSKKDDNFLSHRSIDLMKNYINENRLKFSEYEYK